MADPDSLRLPSEEPLPPIRDLWIAAVFLTLGCAILGLSLGMPTYLDQKGQIYVAPGLVPGLYGIVIAALSLWLAARAIGRRRRGEAGIVLVAVEGTSNVRLVAAAVLCVVFAVGLIGRLPFWLAAATFVTLFVVLFEWQPGLAPRARVRPLSIALALGLATGAAVTLVFEKLFYVRLP